MIYNCSVNTGLLSNFHVSVSESSSAKSPARESIELKEIVYRLLSSRFHLKFLECLEVLNQNKVMAN